MSRGAHLDYDRTGGPLRAAIDAALARSPAAVPQPGGQHALGREGQDPQGLARLAGPLHVRIVRLCPVVGRLDDDNLVGGAKQLRDAIADWLGRRGDSKRDGLTWEVVEERGPWGVRVEFYPQPDSVK